MAQHRVIINRPRRPVYEQPRAVVEAIGKRQLYPEERHHKTHPTPTPLPKGGVGWGPARAREARSCEPTHALACERERSSTEADPVTDLLASANKLTAKQRQELLDQLSLATKLSRSAGADRDLDMWATRVYSALTQANATGEGKAYGQLLVKQLVGAYSAWRPVEAFMEESGLRELKVVERSSVYALLAELLVEHARTIASRSGAPLGPKLVASCAHGIAGIFDRAFPGYLQAGLAKVAARQLIAQRA